MPKAEWLTQFQSALTTFYGYYEENDVGGIGNGEWVTAARIVTVIAIATASAFWDLSLLI